MFTRKVSFRAETIRVYGEESEREIFHILFQGSFSPPIALYYDPSLKENVSKATNPPLLLFLSSPPFVPMTSLVGIVQYSNSSRI